MNILAVIPARFGSQRFPGKPLIRLGGRPMIQWVYEAALQCPAFRDVIVATDDERIQECVQSFGGNVRMTRPDHPSGSDRVAEVARSFPDADVVVNVQGDQPFVKPENLSLLVAPYLDGERPEMTTLACLLSSPAALQDPNTVKVVLNLKRQALYFSRSSIPYFRQERPAPVYHHLGLYAFRRDFLDVYTSLAPTPLEQCEQLEQLRVLENGYTIRVNLAPTPDLEINTPEDLAAAEAHLDRMRDSLSA